MTAPHGFCFAFLTAAILALSSGTAQAQTARTGGVMREKLGHAQRLLEALTTSNRELLVHESTEMVRISKSPQWAELKTRDLKAYTETFLKTVAALDAAARRNDLDTAAAEYSAMTMACYQCHRRLKDLRVARH
jgi:hypothetical protein